jgi:outer membrane protein OmpA-like peptidoglycan-associated protein
LKVRGKSSIEARYFLKVYVEDRKGASSTVTEVLTISNGSATTGGVSGQSQINDPGFTNISWLPQPEAVLYQVFVNGVNTCNTKTTSCIVKRLVGPKSSVSIVTQYKSGKLSLPDPIRYVPPLKPVQIAVANFDLNKSVLSSKDKNEISRVAKLMEIEGYTSIQVTGHTDSSGSDKINTPLSQARAKAVYEYLQRILSGTPISVTLIGKSSKEPVASNATDSGRAANRRAVLSLK